MPNTVNHKQANSIAKVTMHKYTTPPKLL